MRAIILAGGLGTRLYPYTLSTPKPLVPLNDKPILEYVIDLLIKNNFNHITLALNHQADVILKFANEKISKKKIKLDYSIETKKLGTMGPLKLIKDLPNDFLLINADILTDANLSTFFKKHLKSKNIFSILSTERKLPSEFGVIESKKLKVTNFKEKPVYKLQVSTGIYALNREVIKYIPNSFFGFDDLILKLLNKKISINVFKHKGYWLDIGRPSDYNDAQKDLKKLK